MNFILSLLLLLPLLSACTSPTKTPDVNTNNFIIPVNTIVTTTTEEKINNVDVSIKEFVFTPEFVKVKKGTTVTWTNNDQIMHRVKSSLFSSNLINPGQSFSFTFSEAGPVEYYCPIHPTMNGQITVE